MRTAKEIAIISIYTALLIGGQTVLSGVAGVEVVTVMLLAFCYYFGIRAGFAVANAFSVLRCLIFGFFPSVIILYLIYYNIFSAVFGLLGMRFKGKYGIKIHAILLICALFMTVLFTVLDNLITPLYLGFTAVATKAYRALSLSALIPQLICTGVTVLLLFPALIKIFNTTHFNDGKI